MPRNPIDYSKCMIYKLCCDDITITNIYVGHTTNKTRRKQEHNSRCNNSNDKQYNSYVYKFIRENGGWSNWSMIVVEEYPCENKNQAEARERYWIETLQATLNKVIPTRTKQEYMEENREQLREKSKQYNSEHREECRKYNKKYREENEDYHKRRKKEWRERTKEKINCECGGYYYTTEKNKHVKTQKHLKYLEELNN